MPPTLIGIFKGSRLVDVVEHRDTRPEFCRQYNAAVADVRGGLEARPIEYDPLLVELNRARKACERFAKGGAQ